MPTYCSDCGSELDTAPQWAEETDGPCGRCGPDMLVIDLTDRQAEIVDWLMGTPLMEEWFDPVYDAPEGCDFSHLPQPQLEDRRFAVPAAEPVIDDIRHRVTEQLPDQAMMAADVDTRQAVQGLERAANNLVEKLETAMGDV